MMMVKSEEAAHVDSQPALNLKRFVALFARYGLGYFDDPVERVATWANEFVTGCNELHRFDLFGF